MLLRTPGNSCAASPRPLLLPCTNLAITSLKIPMLSPWLCSVVRIPASSVLPQVNLPVRYFASLCSSQGSRVSARQHHQPGTRCSNPTTGAHRRNRGLSRSRPCIRSVRIADFTGSFSIWDDLTTRAAGLGVASLVAWMMLAVSRIRAPCMAKRRENINGMIPCSLRAALLFFPGLEAPFRRSDGASTPVISANYLQQPPIFGRGLAAHEYLLGLQRRAPVPPDDGPLRATSAFACIVHEV